MFQNRYRQGMRGFSCAIGRGSHRKYGKPQVEGAAERPEDDGGSSDRLVATQPVGDKLQRLAVGIAGEDRGIGEGGCDAFLAVKLEELTDVLQERPSSSAPVRVIGRPSMRLSVLFASLLWGKRCPASRPRIRAAPTPRTCWRLRAMPNRRAAADRMAPPEGMTRPPPRRRQSARAAHFRPRAGGVGTR